VQIESTIESKNHTSRGLDDRTDIEYKALRSSWSSSGAEIGKYFWYALMYDFPNLYRNARQVPISSRHVSFGAMSEHMRRKWATGLLALTLVVGPENASVEYYGLAGRIIRAAIAIPQVPMYQDRFNGFEDGERPKEPRYHLVV
jgi:hypothetical protein